MAKFFFKNSYFPHKKPTKYVSDTAVLILFLYSLHIVRILFLYPQYRNNIRTICKLYKNNIRTAVSDTSRAGTGWGYGGWSTRFFKRKKVALRKKIFNQL